MSYVFVKEYGTAKEGQIVDSKYFNYDEMLITLLLDNGIIKYT